MARFRQAYPAALSPTLSRRSVTDRIIGLMLPISAFVAAGFEHSVANMYFPTLAWLLTLTGNVPAGFDASLITTGGVAHNLVPITLGNILGGAGFVGFVYWAICRKGIGGGSNKAERARPANLSATCRAAFTATEGVRSAHRGTADCGSAGASHAAGYAFG